MWSFKDFRFFIYSVSLLSIPLYWSMASLMGQNLSIHDSAGGGYVFYNVFLFALTVVFSFKDIKFRKLNNGNKFLFFVTIFYFLSYLFESILNDATNTEWFTKSFLFFILFSVGGVLLGIVFSQNGIPLFYKHIDFITILIGIGYIRAIPMMIVQGELLGGYQDISYYSALSFGFLLYGFITKRSDRYFIFKFPFSRFLDIIIGILLIICIFASGGRGGILLLIAEVFFCAFTLLKGKNIFTSLMVLSLILALIIVTANLIKGTAVNDVINIGMERGLSYFDSGKVDMSETSNRDVIYQQHLSRIKANPIIGEGIFTLLGKYEWPHNFFIELLASGGLLLLFFWFFILVRCYRNLKGIIRLDKRNLYLVPLILYPSILLLFSSSYIVTRLFWFTISLLISRKYSIPFNKDFSVERTIC